MIVIDPGHGPGNKSRPAGASYAEFVERDLVVMYCVHIQNRLAELGIASRITDGSMSYVQRQTDEGVDLADAYVSCHVNAGKASYGMVMYEQDRDRARALAASVLGFIAEHSAIRFPVLGVWGTGEPEGTDLADRTRMAGKKLRTLAFSDRGRACVSSVSDDVPAILIEPGFIDHEGHRVLWGGDGLSWLGRAIGDGIASWHAGNSSA